LQDSDRSCLVFILFPHSWTNYQTYVIFGGLLVLSVAGVVVQAKLTAKKEPTNAKPEGEEGYPLLEVS